MTHRYAGPKDPSVTCAEPTIVCSCGFESPGDSWRKAFDGFDAHLAREKAIGGSAPHVVDTTAIADTKIVTRADHWRAIWLLLEGCATAIATDDVEAVGELAHMIEQYAGRMAALPKLDAVTPGLIGLADVRADPETGPIVAATRSADGNWDEQMRLLQDAEDVARRRNGLPPRFQR